MISLDSETWLIRPGLLAPPPVVWSFCRPLAPPWLETTRLSAPLFRDIFKNREVIIGHNIAYDMAVLCAARPDFVASVFKHYERGLIRDTQIRQELLDISAGRRQENGRTFVRGGDGSWKPANYSLASLVGKYLDKDRTLDKYAEDAWRKRYAELDGIPLTGWPEAARKYALEDASDTLAVHQAQGGDIVNEQEQARAAWALHLMACWGIRTDAKAVEKLEKVLTEEKYLNFGKLKEAGFFKLRPATKEEREANEDVQWTEKTLKNGTVKKRAWVWARDMEEVQRRVKVAFESRGLETPTTNSGKISTDKDTCKRAGEALLGIYADAGGVDKILQTYVPVLHRGTVTPINPRFRVLVNSGRTSCAEPNLQNLPTGRRVGGVRDCFIPRPGYLFVSVDYDTLELRALAQVCLDIFKQSKMAEAIRAGKDLHLEVAAQLLKIPYEQAEKNKKTDEVKKYRQMAKVANFGLPGGLGVQTLIEYARTGYGVTITEQEAQKLKQQWLAAWPEMNLYFKYISDKVGFTRAPLTQLRSGRVRGECGFTDGCNTLFQGLAADGAKHALFMVSQECYVQGLGSVLFGARPSIFVHDEIIAEVRAEVAHEQAVRLAQVMCSAMAKYIPDVPITATPALMARWLKGAEAVYKDGRLIPWEDPNAVANEDTSKPYHPEDGNDDDGSGALEIAS